MGAPGWDNAPVATIQRVHAKHVTFIYPYYRNQKFLRRQLETWAFYPLDLLRRISIIVVDDGSPTDVAEDVLKGTMLPVRLFCIERDVRWNWLAARNIAFANAPEGWCLATDMDHVITAEFADSVVHGNHDSNVIYRLSRREHTGAQIHPHPNSFLITRAMFWKVGGYDEALSGHYGTDGDWRRRCAATAPIRTLPDELVRYEYQDDSSTTHYKRKQPEDAGKKRIIASRGKGWRPKTLSFPFHEVSL